jgi:putative addiction module component (TIGR02574 family)
MNDRYESILKAALALPEAERIFLIDDLMESLPPDTGPLSDEEMLAELERRHAEVEQGLVKPIPWEEVRRHLWEDK